MEGQGWVEEMRRRLEEEQGRAVWLREEELVRLCDAVQAVLESQPMLVEVRAPISVVGDIHGQFRDLQRLFQHSGNPGHHNPYLFLGDYVDRGKQSTETIALLFCYKVLYPDKVWLLRGNHESAPITQIYGFYTEMSQRYSAKLWKRFTDTFDWLPVAALVQGLILCMHGGLSPHLDSWDSIRALKRPQEVPFSGLMCDLLWSDPSTHLPDGWGDNTRGLAFSFSAAVVRSFCRAQGLDLVVRAHQVVEAGYAFFAGRRLLTIFSAPNYCGEFQNNAVVLKVSADLECYFLVLRPSHPAGHIPKPKCTASNPALPVRTNPQ